MRIEFLSKANYTEIIVGLLAISAALYNLLTNWSVANFREKTDYHDIVEYVNEKAIPGTRLFTTRMENNAIGAYQGLVKLRRDFYYPRHNFELNADFFKPGVPEINLNAFLFHRDIESKDKLYYVKDIESIRRSFFVAPLESAPKFKFRHIVADIGNNHEYQALAERNIYYLFPKEIEANLNKEHLLVDENSASQSAFYFVSNVEFKSTAQRLQVINSSYPVNIFVPARSQHSSRVELDISLDKEASGLKCKFESAQLLFFYNNHFVKQTEASFGDLRIQLDLPSSLNLEKVNVLSFVLSFNQNNQFSSSLIDPTECIQSIHKYEYSVI